MTFSYEPRACVEKNCHKRQGVCNKYIDGHLASPYGKPFKIVYGKKKRTRLCFDHTGENVGIKDDFYESGKLLHRTIGNKASVLNTADMVGFRNFRSLSKARLQASYT